MVNKKIVIICTIIAIGIITAIVAANITMWRKHFYIDLENQNNVNILSNLEDELNLVTENNVNENINEIQANEPQNTTLGEEEKIGESTETDKSEEAISLAKKEWGETDETVYYTVDNSSKNIYTISVRSKSTTAQLAEYEVDVSSKTVTIK